MKTVEFKKVSTTDLKSAAKELTVLLGLEPAIDSSSKDALITGINEAFDLLEDGEEDELSDKTRKLYDAWKSEQTEGDTDDDEMDYDLDVKPENEIDVDEVNEVAETPKKAKKEKETPAKEGKKEKPVKVEDAEIETETDLGGTQEITPLTDAEKTTLIKTITKATDLKRLIEMIKGYGKDIFPVATRGLFLQKDIDKLKSKAIADLKGESIVPEKKEKSTKAEKVKKEKTIAKNGVSAQYLIRKYRFTNPEYSAEKILQEIEKQGTSCALISVKMRMAEMDGCLQILKELKKI